MTESRQVLERAVEQHMRLCLQVALAALEMVDRDPPYADQVMDLRALMERVEVSALILSVEGGTSWSTIAADMRVTRQSLHYRLSRKGTKWLSDMRKQLDLDGASGDFEKANSRVWRELVTKLSRQVIRLAGPTNEEELGDQSNEHPRAEVSANVGARMDDARRQLTKERLQQILRRRTGHRA